MKKLSVVIFLIVAFSANAMSTTWGPAEHVCPVCKSKNTYQEIMSYGSYIYHWPSKYQYVFWPLTDNPSVYCCPSCSFSTFMWDFDSIPDNRIDPIKTYLSTVKPEGRYLDYLEIPMTLRLEIAEGVYKILGKDAAFWCKFYRVMGYHYSAAKEKMKASESRKKALKIAETMVNDTVYKGQEKENLFIIAAMYHFTDQKDSALVFLDKAATFKYTNKKMNDENANGLDNYLSDLIDRYKEFIKKEE